MATRLRPKTAQLLSSLNSLNFFGSLPLAARRGARWSWHRSALASDPDSTSENDTNTSHQPLASKESLDALAAVLNALPDSRPSHPRRAAPQPPMRTSHPPPAADSIAANDNMSDLNSISNHHVDPFMQHPVNDILSETSTLSLCTNDKRNPPADKSSSPVDGAAPGDSADTNPKPTAKRRPKDKPRKPIERTLETVILSPKDLSLKPIDAPDTQNPPRLASDLERTLFSRNPIFLQDPDSGEFNFDHRFANIPHRAEFDYNRLPPFVYASEDKRLIAIARNLGRKFISSTSSITSALSRIILAITSKRAINLDRLSPEFNSQLNTQVKSLLDSTGIVLKYRDGIYAVNVLKLVPEDVDKNVLSDLGRVLEKMLCVEPEEFQSYLTGAKPPTSSTSKDASASASIDAPTSMDASAPTSTNASPPTSTNASPPTSTDPAASTSTDAPAPTSLSEPKPMAAPTTPEVPFNDAYHYSAGGDFLLRAQLDCYHPDLPRKTFDIKTRATLAIRMDAENYQANTDYIIHSFKGLYQSFEREYYDILRSAMVKYGLQARIGNMDGIFICYHNTAKIFGFQYVPLTQIDQELYGGTVFAQNVFSLALQLLGKILDQAIQKYPKRDIRIMFSPHRDNRLLWFVQPAATESDSSTAAATATETATETAILSTDTEATTATATETATSSSSIDTEATTATLSTDTEATATTPTATEAATSSSSSSTDAEPQEDPDPLDPSTWHPQEALKCTAELICTINNTSLSQLPDTHAVSETDTWQLSAAIQSSATPVDRCNDIVQGLITRMSSRNGNPDYVNYLRKLTPFSGHRVVDDASRVDRDDWGHMDHVNDSFSDDSLSGDFLSDDHIEAIDKP